MKQILRYGCIMLAVTVMASVASAGLPLPPPPPGLPSPKKLPLLPPPPGVKLSGQPVKVKNGKQHKKKKHRNPDRGGIQINIGR
ncbi:hypothetical protein [Trichlorobacter sp.]|uniref:hypothetical protein n=1 Tax=Trichlorobacter sp. TaxID=2911007 RepID=UPI002A35BBAC|nr:hypothetical protein [Trichlorobacter sp.]MDY0384397.1 hypothetical protein [Trichlorobacter sp.]